METPWTPLEMVRFWILFVFIIVMIFAVIQIVSDWSWDQEHKSEDLDNHLQIDADWKEIQD